MISYRFVPISSQKGVLFLRHPVFDWLIPNAPNLNKKYHDFVSFHSIGMLTSTIYREYCSKISMNMK